MERAIVNELYNQGTEQLEKYELGKALELFSELIQKEPLSPLGFLGLAKTSLLLGNIETAEESAKQAESLTQEKADARVILAMCSMGKGKPEEAVSILKRTNTWFPNHPLVLANLGKSLAQMSQYTEAMVYSLKALPLVENPYDVYYDLAGISLGLEQYEESIQYLLKCIEANPTFLPAFERLAEVAKILGQIGNAIELFELGLSSVPENLYLRSELIALYMLESNTDKAMEHALELAGRRGHSDDYVMIGNLCLLLEDVEAAKISYETAMNMDKESLSAVINLAHLYRVEQKREKSIEFYKKALEILPNAYQPLLGIGLVYEEIDADYQKAKLCFMKAIQMEPKSFDLLFHLAFCHHQLQEKTEALRYIEVARGIADSPAQYQRVQTLLQQIQNLPSESDPIPS